MIRRDTDEGWLMITQSSHAWVAGQLAQAWGSNLIAAPIPLKEVVMATSLHDLGWMEGDTVHQLHPDGRPVDFREVTLQDYDEIWGRAVTKLSSINPYAAALVSMHATTVFTVVQRFPEAERVIRLDRQEQIRQTLIRRMQRSGVYQNGELTPEHLEAAYRVLRACDLLSLAICADTLTGDEIPNVLAVDGNRTTISYRPLDDHTLSLSPWPFALQEIQVMVEARFLPQRTYPDLASYHAAMNEAEWRYLPYRFVAG